MLERPLRILAIALSLLVTAGFALFALDDFSRASSASRDRIAGYAATDPAPAAERRREGRNGRARELVDDANDVLLRPFTGIVDAAPSRWVQRGVPALLGLVVYGFLLGYLARYHRGHGRALSGRRRRGSRSGSSERGSAPPGSGRAGTRGWPDRPAPTCSRASRSRG